MLDGVGYWASGLTLNKFRGQSKQSRAILQGRLTDIAKVHALH